MEVTLLSYTPDALNLLLRTKGTRLAHADNPATWTDEKRQEHLEYMRDTIKSSWEFVDYVFKIEGVTRAFTHQMVRTRAGSYAQESQRTVDVSDHDVVSPDFHGDALKQDIWDHGAAAVMKAYKDNMQVGMHPQDARGILPTNITTSIVAKYNLRTMHEMAKLRLCTRTQGEYQNVFRRMREEVVKVHPWTAEFIEVYCASHGTCAFPRYGKAECPLYKYTLPQEQLLEIRNNVRQHADVERHEATPIAHNGKAM